VFSEGFPILVKSGNDLLVVLGSLLDLFLMVVKDLGLRFLQLEALVE
jgi:hypothetical protein